MVIAPLSCIIEGMLYVEEWEDLIGYEDHYMVSSFGRIKSLAREVHRKLDSVSNIPETLKKQRVNKFGYSTVYVSINKKYKHYMTHVLVAEHFIGKKPTPSHQVNHKDGNKQNNHVSNLEWTTPSENKKHAYRLGLMCQKGENHASNKLNNDQVLYIFTSTVPVKELAVKFGVCKSSITNIKKGYTWAHITGKQYQKAKRLTKQEILDIFNSPDKNAIIAKRYGLKTEQVYKIKTGWVWKSITKHNRNEKKAA